MLLDISVCIIIFLIGFNLKNFFKGFSIYDNKILTQLFFYHFGIAILFHFYVNNFGGDALGYWLEPKSNSFQNIINIVSNGGASGALYLLNYFPSKILNLSFFTGNMFYALFGYLGIVYFYSLSKSLIPSIKNITSYKVLGIPIFPWIWFLPNLHFWSSGIGKDTILFFCISLFIYSFQRKSKKIIGIFISLLLSLLIRPHITLFLIIAFGVGYAFDSKLKGYQKIAIILIFLIGFVSIFNSVLNFVHIESFDTQTIEDFTSKKAFNLSKKVSTGSAVDISGYPFPLKVFTFLYRPFFIDGFGVLSIIASIENLFLLAFSFAIIKNKPMKILKNGTPIIIAILVFFILGTISFSMILGNLGIMMRQKNMFIPSLIIFGSWIISRNNSNNEIL
ncbi:MAG: hypothetical protein QM499_01950 [Flavobacteriaceae bacterium]